ncbi:hypothetical protein ACFQ3S_18070 [Mucilaginibacter terrae]|uniref:hypothetical protein n=1 Tax=Mucilaginibacter terrae TaxID=1955052 RepID=UPI00362E01C3
MRKIKSFISSTILIFFGQILFAQNKLVTYSNLQNAYYNKDTSNAVKDGPLKGLAFLEPKVNEITLNTDSTFDFWSRPNVSCFTWRKYKGTWKKSRDTVLFYDNFEVVENDVRVIYKKNNEPIYHIRFFTDKNSELNNRVIKVQYIYDFNFHLEDIEKLFYLNVNNEIEIPFQDILNRDKLAAVRIEYLLDNKQKRFSYLTQNGTVNIKESDLPNVIGVEFVENPKKEIVYRTIKGLVKNGAMVIVSTIKSKISLPDYHSEIMFEKSYTLDK